MESKFICKAFWIALVGTVLLLAGAILGKLFLCGDITKSLIVVLPSVAALWIFMLMIRYARTTAPDRNLWEILEKVFMVAFWALIIIVPVNYAIYAFCTLFSNGQLHTLAQSDAAKVEQFYSDYEDFRSTALDKAAADIENYIKSGDSTDAALLEYVSGITKNMDINKVRIWRKESDDPTEIIDDEWDSFKTTLDNSWNVFRLSDFAQTLNNKCSNVKSEVENKMTMYGDNNKLIPEIVDVNNSGKYKLCGYASFDGIKDAPSKSEFADRLLNVGAMLAGNIIATVFGVILWLIIALAVFVFALNDKIHKISPKRS